MRGLEGRVAVVTGAAGGMGAAAAIRLGEEKVKVALLDIKDCSDVVNTINRAGGEAQAWNCDTTDEAQLAETMKAVADTFGGINILVNNAGLLSPRIPFMEWETEQVERFMDVNYMGYVKTTRAAAAAPMPPAAPVTNGRIFIAHPSTGSGRTVGNKVIVH